MSDEKNTLPTIIPPREVAPWTDAEEKQLQRHENLEVPAFILFAVSGAGACCLTLVAAMEPHLFSALLAGAGALASGATAFRTVSWYQSKLKKLERGKKQAQEAVIAHKRLQEAARRLSFEREQAKLAEREEIERMNLQARLRTEAEPLLRQAIEDAGGQVRAETRITMTYDRGQFCKYELVIAPGVICYDEDAPDRKDLRHSARVVYSTLSPGVDTGVEICDVRPYVSPERSIPLPTLRSLPAPIPPAPLRAAAKLSGVTR